MQGMNACSQHGVADSSAQENSGLGAFAQRRTTELWKKNHAVEQEESEVKIGSLEWVKLSAKRKWAVARRLAVRVRLLILFCTTCHSGHRLYVSACAA
jgi:hypothetical protein